MDHTSLNNKNSIVVQYANQVNELVNMILSDYCQELDLYITSIYNRWIVNNEIPNDEQLNDIVMKIPLYLYYNNSLQEKLGSSEDLAKIIKDDTYNKALLKATGTVKEKEAVADIAILEDKIIHIAYNTAYKQIQQKFNLALELLNSAKKLQAVRMNERDLTGRVR